MRPEVSCKEPGTLTGDEEMTRKTLPAQPRPKSPFGTSEFFRSLFRPYVNHRKQ